MFSKLFGSKPKQSSAPAADPTPTTNVPNVVPDLAVDTAGMEQLSLAPLSELNMDLDVEIGGTKGWPSDASVVFYHRAQGLICIGTEGGGVYSCGDGFQFFRPWLTSDANEVVSITAASRDSILVTFGDNSMAILELPSLTVVDLLEGNWLDSSSAGNVTFVHVDEPGEKSFAYVGTTLGNVFILEVRDSFRICDLVLTPADFGIAQPMAVAEIQLCPKDEKYIAVAFSGSSKDVGAVVIYNFLKSKIKVNAPTGAITSLAWSHQGDVLYAGSREGSLLCVNLEKHTSVEVWNAKCESEDEDLLPSIRRLIWHAPQRTNDPPVLFILLGPPSDFNCDGLRSSLIALSPLGSYGEFEQVFSLPTVPTEDVVGIRLVPTVDKNRPASVRSMSSSASNLTAQSGCPLVPALLMVTQKKNCKPSNVENHSDNSSNDDNASKSDVDEDGPPHRQLMIVRCPSCPIKDWPLELASVEAPRKATEVLPGTAEVTAMTALSPNSNRNSWSSFAIRNANSSSYSVDVEPSPSPKRPASYRSDAIMENDDEDEDDPVAIANANAPETNFNNRASRRMSARDFLSGLSVLVTDEKPPEAWELVLAGVVDDDEEESKKKDQDVVIFGHADGMVVSWGVFLPEQGSEYGRGSSYVPLNLLKCGTVEVSAVTVDDDAGLLLAGDISGELVLWEQYNEQTHEGQSVRFIRYKSRIQRQLSVTGPLTGDEDDESINALSPVSADGDSFEADGVRECLRGNVANAITSLLIVSEATAIVVGTENGIVLMGFNFSMDELKKVELGKVGGASGPVVNLSYGAFYYGIANVAAVYVVYQSNHVAVIHLATQTLLAYSCGPVSDGLGGETRVFKMPDGSGACLKKKLAACIVDSEYRFLPKMDPNQFDPSLRDRSATVATDGSNYNNNADDASPTPTRRAYRFFSTSSADSSAKSPTAAAPVAVNIPPRCPRYFVTTIGESMVTYDLSKFALASKVGSNSFSGVNSQAVTSQVKLSSFEIVGSSIISFSDSSEGESAVPVPCLGCVDTSGSLSVVSIHNQKVVCLANLLEGVAEGNVLNLESSVLLSTGNCYLLEEGRIVYSSCVRSSTHNCSNSSLPMRQTPISCPPKGDMQFLTGREQAVAATKLAVKKRRQSMITITAGPTDLDKIFAKTRTASQKDLLFGRANSSDVGSASPDNRAKSATRSAAAVSANMIELQDELHKRGQRISQLAEKMEKFKESSQEFRKLAQEHNQKLKAKNAAWGLGLF